MDYDMLLSANQGFEANSNHQPSVLQNRPAYSMEQPSIKTPKLALNDLDKIADLKVPLRHARIPDFDMSVFCEEPNYNSFDFGYVFDWVARHLDNKYIIQFVELLVKRFPFITLTIDRFDVIVYCLTPTQLESILTGVPAKAIWTVNLCCRDEPGQRPADFINVLTRAEQRPKIYIGDHDYISKFVALSTISDWERLVRLDVVEICPHFYYDDSGNPYIDIVRFNELVSSISPAPRFNLDDIY